MSGSELAIVRAYHEGSKHHFHRFAPGPRGLDWANQPDPFLRYEGAELVALARDFPVSMRERVDLAAAVEGRAPPSRLDARSLARFFFDSLALSAWKEYRGASWALRVNPSSGNLHPTEAYPVLGPVEGLSKEAAVWHYAPREHALERRAVLSAALWQRLSQGQPGFFVVLASILWREAWKYGERGFRYCQHDLGHALGALATSAAGLGWELRCLDEISTDELVLGLGLESSSGPESPAAEVAVWVRPRPESRERSAPREPELPPELFEELARLEWRGRPRPLSFQHVRWREAERCVEATKKPRTPRAGEPGPDEPSARSGFEPPERDLRELVRRRRSAVALDGQTAIARGSFYRMLDATLPRADRAPWGAWSYEANVALAIFVHRVEGLERGLYALARDPAQEDDLRQVLRPEFLWLRAPEAHGLALSLLLPLDLGAASAEIACRQEIAADGAFSLGMLARFERPLLEHGPWFYRRLFWECGMIGQVLYLEAEAAEVRGTGIGCFFDDPLHELLGLGSSAWQDLYHFTVGGAVDDPRLSTHPAYEADLAADARPSARAR